VTICTQNRKEFFGEIRNGIMGLNEIGCMVGHFWKEIINHFDNVFLDEWVVMLNHIHGIIVINNQTNFRRDVALQRLYTGNHPKMSTISPKSNSLPSIIRSFKSIVTKIVNQKYLDMSFEWQPRFYDRIIRNEKELNQIREYIQYNPSMWERDRNSIIS
jgi:putative transposase